MIVVAPRTGNAGEQVLHNGLADHQAVRALGPDRTSLSTARRDGVEVILEGHLGHASGVSLKRHGDAEALEELYLSHGAKALEMVDGSFTFAIVDRRTGAVHMGIDKIGQALGYLVETPANVYFASTLTELLRALPFKPDLDISSVYEFLKIGWVISPHSMFQGVEKITPGSYARFDGKVLSRVTYHKPLHRENFVERSTPELGREIRQHIRTGVQRGLPWADQWSSFLSGGLDSSSVVFTLAGELGAPFPTFYGTFGTLDKYMALPDEERVARAVAQKFRTNHSVVTIQPDVIHRVPEIVGCIEEPIYDGGPVVVDAVMDAAHSSGADGIMTGIGGDFLFGGERRHLLISLLHRTRNLPGWDLADRLARVPTPWLPRLTRVRFDVQRTCEVRKLSMADFYDRRLHGADIVNSLCKPAILEAIDRKPIDKIQTCLDEVAHLDDLTALCYIDFRLLTPDGLTRDVVALGRDHQLQVCSPYLDSEFVDFSMTMPPKEKVRRLTQKYAFRNAIRGYVPDDVLKKKKGGLGAPIRYWVTHDDLVAEHLSQEVVEERGLFDYSAIKSMREDTLTERRDASLTLWSLFTLESWMRQFVDQSFSADAGGADPRYCADS